MSVTKTEAKGTRVEPFVLKWAEQAPAESLWSRQSVFSAPVNGLDISMATETEHPETTGGHDTQDSTTA
jgi:hypothetical protein